MSEILSKPSRVAAALAVVTSLSVLGCGAAGSDAPENELGEGETLTVRTANGLATGQVQTEGGHFAQGSNVFLVAFDPASTDLTTASAFMPVHGHGTDPPAVARTTAGFRVSKMVFSMPGLWDVTFNVTVGSEADKLEFSVDVP